MKLLVATVVFFTSVQTYGKGCIMTFDLTALKQGITTTCAETTPVPPNFCRPKKVRKGISYKLANKCPSNYLAKCTQDQKALNETLDNIRKLPGAKVTSKSSDVRSYITYYYDQKDLANGKLACDRGAGKWFAK